MRNLKPVKNHIDVCHRHEVGKVSGQQQFHDQCVRVRLWSSAEDGNVDVSEKHQDADQPIDPDSVVVVATIRSCSVGVGDV